MSETCKSNNKDIKLANTAGFCYGVKRAVETVKKLKTDNPEKDIFVLGELIHNTDVINELEDLGIKTFTQIPDKISDGICVIRSHGESPKTIEKIKSLGLQIVDLTCPDVKKVQQKAIELAQNDYYVVIVGKSEHPEVIGIKANVMLYTDKVIVASCVEHIIPFAQELKSHKKIGVVVQTTQTISTLTTVIDYLTPLSKELIILNTICPSTSMRQQEAQELAKESDLMIVVGSKKSANTTHLAEILKTITTTIHIENGNELAQYSDLVNKSKKISITAGASTPQNIIQNVIDSIN